MNFSVRRPVALAQEVREEFYTSGYFHRIYFGEILAGCADEATHL